MLEQLRHVCLLAWLTFSAVTAPLLAAPFLLPEQTTLALAGACRTRVRAEHRCPVCGMTRAFLALAHGDLQGAARSNRAAVPLFAILLANGAGACLTILRRRRQLKRIIMVDKAGD